MNFEEQTLTSEYVYKGKVLDIKKDEVLISNGHKSTREVVEHSGGVVIMAIHNDKVLVVEQFRYPLKTTSIELPAGKLEKNENPDDASKRELKEETGYIAHDWESLGYIYTTPGFCDEKLHLYLAQNLEFIKEMPDEDEIIRAQKIPIKELYKNIQDGIINDSKTICTAFRARKYLND